MNFPLKGKIQKNLLETSKLKVLEWVQIFAIFGLLHRHRLG